MSAAMRPARSTVYWNVLVPGRRAQVVSTVAAPAEVLWQLVEVHQRGRQVVVKLGRRQGIASVTVIATIYTALCGERYYRHK